MLIQFSSFVIPLLSAYGFSFAEDVIKCLKMPSEKIKISCPKHHVIYNPQIIAASGSSCIPSPTDCTGSSKKIKRQTDRCFWKRRCTIKLRQDYEISSCSNNFAMTHTNVSYIIIKQTYCFPKDLIIDMCKRPPKGFDFHMGIIRSHRGYPRTKPNSLTCKLEIPIDLSNTLVMETKSEEVTSLPELTILEVKLNGVGCSNVSSDKELVLNGNDTKAVKIFVDYRRKRKTNTGFTISFMAYRSTELEAFLLWPNRSRPVMREMGRIYEVRPVLEQCAVDVDGHMRLVCDKDEVIYFPAVHASGYTRINSKCTFSNNHQCGGFTPELLVQRNLCYWKNSCDITWNDIDRIVVSKVHKCIGYEVSSIGLSGHRCVHKDDISDVCSNATDVINTSWGIVRSHALYPWYFDLSFPECKRIVYIGGRHILRLYVQDMNLDPDGRDKFTVEHVRKNVRKEIMNVKSGQEGAEQTVKGGKIVIKFKPFEASKAGRGFVLVFTKFLVSKQRLGFTGQPDNPMTDTGALSDSATSSSRRLSNWRLCSQKGKTRKRGRTCNNLVWTDYFTRLE